MPRGMLAVGLAGVAMLVVVLFMFDSHLLAERCDDQVKELTKEKQRASKHIKELRQALAESAETLERLRTRRADASTLHSQLDALSSEAGQSRTPSRRRARSHATTPPEDAEAPSAAREQPPAPVRDWKQAAGPEPERVTEHVPEPASVSAAGDDDSLLTPGRIAVVVIAYNRAPYLDRALKSIFKHHPGGGRFPVYVSQDGENAEVAAVAERHGARRIVHPRKVLKFKPGTYISKFPGYSYLAVHYGWALGTLFADAAAYEGVIILEEDIEVAPDFFDYFTATAPLLYQDESLLCVSAFNDNGQEKYASDATALYRSDFFPGLGWLMTRRLWGELGPTWPNEKGFWDDWLREPPQRHGRASIRPEVSRTYTFGEKGTSQGQFSKLLRVIKLGASAALSSSFDARHLLKPAYDAAFAAALGAAAPVTLEQLQGGHAFEGDVKLLYRDAKHYEQICKRLGIMEDLKAGVPRTGYQGVVTLRLRGKEQAASRARLFLAPAYPLVDVPNGKIV